MKILFINVPPGLEYELPSKNFFKEPPIAHLWLSAVLEKHGIFTDIYDAYTVGANTETILDYIEMTQPDMIGFSVFTVAVFDVLYIVKKIKQRLPDIPIIVGGNHTSVSVEDLIQTPEVDFACIGEGEFTLIELIQALKEKKSLNDIKGLVYRDGDEIKVNPIRELRTDMDNVPHLAYHKVIHNNYYPWWDIINDKKHKFISTVTGKGCPMNCIWCDIARTEGLKYRCMSAERVIDELLYLKKVFGVTHLAIDDANFTVYKKRVIKICENIIRKKIDIKWVCSSTIRNADDIDLLRLMKSAGCHAIFLGVESGNDAILNRVKKVSKEKVINVVKKTWVAGIQPHCSFILGLPNGTKKTMQETIDFSIKLNPSSASFSIAIPFKGTVLYEEYEKKGYIKTKDWRKYDSHAVFETEEFSASYLEQLFLTAHRHFYWRPTYIFRKLKTIRSFKEFMFNVDVGLDLLLKKISYKN